jgi:RNA polymerase sigma-70 factor (ECF subfamily)
MNEKHLLMKLEQGDKEIFFLLFTSYYKDLVLFGGNFLPDKAACEDIVQSIFLHVWKSRKTLVIESSLKSYLLKSVRNRCMNEIRRRQVVCEYNTYVLSSQAEHDLDTENYTLYSDLQKQIRQMLEQLPETFRTTFELNRFEGLKYREIAQKLAVSERTVEVHINEAISLLKKYLQEYLIWIALLFIP